MGGPGVCPAGGGECTCEEGRLGRIGPEGEILVVVSGPIVGWLRRGWGESASGMHVGGEVKEEAGGVWDHGGREKREVGGRAGL